jgi:hypothetical protein
MTLHALGGGGLPPDCEVTVTFTAADALLPGLGFDTLSANIPAVGAEPVAVSFDVET